MYSSNVLSSLAREIDDETLSRGALGTQSLDVNPGTETDASHARARRGKASLVSVQTTHARVRTSSRHVFFALRRRGGEHHRHVRRRQGHLFASAPEERCLALVRGVDALERETVRHRRHASTRMSPVPWGGCEAVRQEARV